MEFDEWYAREGRLMAEGGCAIEVVARAAFFVATNEEREACKAACEARENGDPTDGHDGGVAACVSAISERSNAEVSGRAS